METKLCRICGKLGTTHQDIFKIEGLKHKIETCLPILVTQHCLLPDTICQECLENVSQFYLFIKNCLQSIIVLESQYDVTESCLKSKRRQEKSCMVNFTTTMKTQDTQTEDKYDIIFTKYKENLDKTKLPFEGCDINLVDYEVESETSEAENSAQNQGVVVVQKEKFQRRVDNFLDNLLATKTVFAKSYFDDFENKLISEIVQRKGVKRSVSSGIENLPMKICKIDSGGNRRKCRSPKKVENITEMTAIVDIKEENEIDNEQETDLEIVEQNGNTLEMTFPQICLLCQGEFSGPAALAAHIFEVHDLDFNQILESSCEKKKKIPNLLKISDIKRSNSFDENQQCDSKSPQTQLPPLGAQNHQTLLEHSCQSCPFSSSTKQELLEHCRSEHSMELPLMCGICFQPTTSLINLKNHLKICVIEYPVTTRYFCSICKYGEDGVRGMENHVLVHDFLLDMCKKEMRMFDPADYIELNPSCESGPLSPASKSLACNLCLQSNFQSFKEFSDHRRKQHSKFHCDLCNKFYGRNSHLWKHVNRLHKNHPSITCQICYKTSASKYHLAQHFSKIHAAKQKVPMNVTSVPNDAESRSQHFVFRKFQNFDFQEKKSTSSEFDDISNNAASDLEISDEVFVPDDKMSVPKEVDASSDLYTNIITNYTPPPNKGEFKCPKCSKGFSKKLLLKKHKKNCRPKLQKDLLTRCKSCARIFKDRQSLAKHLVNYHSEYTCEICLQKTQSKCEIVSHIRFTHPNCSLFCNVCGNILRSKQNLADHVKDHSNSYVCQFCGDSLTSKIKLKMHILSLHRKILSLSCGICLKLFENQHILRNHVQLSHKNELRPFTSCTVCGKNYGSKWKTYDHLNKSHGRIFKACKTCLEIFDTEEELNLHSEEMHSVKNQVNMKNTQFNYLKQDSEDVDDSETGKDEVEDLEDNDKGTEEIFNNFATEMSGFSKISLLEKRLLGKKVTNDEVPVKICKVEDKPKSNVVKTKVTASKKTLDSSKFEDDMSTQQGSSKRTVYVNSDVPSLCEICFKTWPAKKHLWQHYIRCHKSVAATVCGICLKTNVDYRALQQHLRSNHPTLLHGQGFGSNFICRICGRYHNASSKLKLHMAIHENFDWSILETKNDVPVNGEPPEIRKGFEENERYFESLIEQVECSSNDEEESDYGSKNNEEKNEEDNSSTSEIADEESDSDSSGDSTQNDETQTFQNSDSVVRNADNRTFKTSSSTDCSSPRNEDCGAKTRVFSGGVIEFQSSESEDSSSESCSSEDEAIRENERSNSTCSNEPLLVNGITNSNSNGLLGNALSDSLPFADNGLFRFKTEELDSAVKSISLECEEEIKENLEIEYCELPMNASLNEREIESAVGSIL
ncbi:hypothetical protein HHI36_021259 [Cryptolaemus montrouzieri]|uniref:Uncharacterized protein n=1 Tax=Cryptolaemus montrouzieri TaxID=559131 RepID=A0ABD2MWF2_9CUCU